MGAGRASPQNPNAFDRGKADFAFAVAQRKKADFVDVTAGKDGRRIDQARSVFAANPLAIDNENASGPARCQCESIPANDRARPDRLALFVDAHELLVPATADQQRERLGRFVEHRLLDLALDGQRSGGKREQQRKDHAGVLPHRFGFGTTSGA